MHTVYMYHFMPLPCYVHAYNVHVLIQTLFIYLYEINSALLYDLRMDGWYRLQGLISHWNMYVYYVTFWAMHHEGSIIATDYCIM